jgi:hypothetical protein
MMKWTRSLALVALAASAVVAGDEKQRSYRFGKDDLGKLPAGWKADHTGKGEGSVWKVVTDDTAPSRSGYVLAQTAESPNAFFNLCVAQDANYQDAEISVAFKAIRGKNDQGGGLVWRYRDHDNYYICRMNPLEDNFRVYKVVAGKRIQLGTKEDLKVPAGEWHTIKVTQEGDHIQCWLDDKKYLDVKDSTFTGAGKVGLWSKSDAQTHFDNLKVAANSNPPASAGRPGSRRAAAKR